MENNLPQITYLFGAGASANALPTIKGLPARIEFIKNYLSVHYLFDENDTYTVSDFTFKKNEAKLYLLKGLDDLHTYSTNHSTIDTYAKKLDLNSESSKVYELCFFLALYFNLEQKVSGVDSRYDTFLISILTNSSYSFPTNLKFLSWNYDIQMEMSHARLTNRHDLNFHLFNKTDNNLSQSEFCSVKINGSCGIVDQFKRLFPLLTNITVPECGADDLDFALSFGFGQIYKKRSYIMLGLT